MPQEEFVVACVKFYLDQELRMLLRLNKHDKKSAYWHIFPIVPSKHEHTVRV
jgi:hypothetical protein